MDAIQDTKAMAGSPDADFAIVSRTASCRLAHGFCVSGGTSFRETMKENHDV
jgi:hypothetical protein